VAGDHAARRKMADARQPGFVTALVAVAVGGVVSSWISALFQGFAPATSMESGAILTSVFGAVGVKLVLRVLGYDVAFVFAAGALLAGPNRRPGAAPGDAGPRRASSARLADVRALLERPEPPPLGLDRADQGRADAHGDVLVHPAAAGARRLARSSTSAQT
jgi:uncharacterized membrane protein YeaQ/YmgE (transglycosylase-associated protein family)